MSPRGGKRTGQRPPPRKPAGEKWARRFYTLPPDIAAWVDSQPAGERSKMVAAAIRFYLEHRDTGAASGADDHSEQG
jgi:hypothetical protein